MAVGKAVFFSGPRCPCPRSKSVASPCARLGPFAAQPTGAAQFRRPKFTCGGGRRAAQPGGELLSFPFLSRWPVSVPDPDRWHVLISLVSLRAEQLRTVRQPAGSSAPCIPSYRSSPAGKRIQEQGRRQWRPPGRSRPATRRALTPNRSSSGVARRAIIPAALVAKTPVLHAVVFLVGHHAARSRAWPRSLCSNRHSAPLSPRSWPRAPQPQFLWVKVKPGNRNLCGFAESSPEGEQDSPKP